MNKAIIRKDLLEQQLKVPVGNIYIYSHDSFDYRWSNDDTKFEILYQGKWLEAYSIDFDFIEVTQ